MERYDVTIIGAGLAGLFLAQRLGQEGHSVLLADRKTDLSKGVHTTGIFVRKTLEDFEFPPELLGPPISDVRLFSPSLDHIDLASEEVEFRVGRMGRLYGALLESARRLGVEFASGNRFLWSVPKKRKGGILTRGGSSRRVRSVVALERNGEKRFIETKVVVGADGARSKAARDLGLDKNRAWIVGFEEVFSSHGVGEPMLNCFLSNRFAPGYLAWIASDGEETHIGVGGYPSRFDPREALKVFKREVVPQVIDKDGLKKTEQRGGRIPVGGILYRIASDHGLLVGDAAGAVSPLTAGGLDPCLRLSQFAAEVITERLETGDPTVLRQYSGAMFRKKFATRLLMRTALKNARSDLLLNLLFPGFKTSLGREVAEKVFFRRASFPDIGVGHAKRAPVIFRG